jgi:TolB protein
VPPSAKATNCAGGAPRPPINDDIVFVRSGDLFSMTAAGVETQLTSGPDSDQTPSWSPDKRVVFARGSGLAWVAASGGAVTSIPNTAGAGQPAWSPDGTRIAFVRNGNIEVIPAAGGASKVIDVAEPVGEPTWSPESCFLAFTWQQRVLKARDDGTGITLVRTLASEPSWAPDGRLAVTISVNGRGEIFVLENGGATQVTNGGGRAPSWSADSSAIAFHSYRTGAGDVYTEAPNGDPGTLRRVTSSGIAETDPAW